MVKGAGNRCVDGSAEGFDEAFFKLNEHLLEAGYLELLCDSNTLTVVAACYAEELACVDCWCGSVHVCGFHYRPEENIAFGSFALASVAFSGRLFSLTHFGADFEEVGVSEIAFYVPAFEDFADFVVWQVE